MGYVRTVPSHSRRAAGRPSQYPVAGEALTRPPRPAQPHVRLQSWRVAAVKLLALAHDLLVDRLHTNTTTVHTSQQRLVFGEC